MNIMKVMAGALIIFFNLPYFNYGQETIKIPGCNDTVQQTNSPWELTVSSFIKGVAKKKPVAYGWFVCIVAGTEAIALAIMTLELSQNSISDQEVRDKLLEYISLFKMKIEAYSCLAELDNQAYQKYLQALRMPHTTEEETLIRNQHLYNANVESTEIPLHSGELASEVLSLIKTSVPSISRKLMPDIQACTLILASSGRSMLLLGIENAKNLPANDLTRFTVKIQGQNKLIQELTSEILAESGKILTSK